MREKFGLIGKKVVKNAKVRVSWQGKEEVFDEKRENWTKEIRSEDYRGLFSQNLMLQSEGKLE